MTEQWQAELADREKQRDFERYKFEREIELKKEEQSASSGRGFRVTAAQATVAASLLTLLGGGIGAVIQWKATSDAEQIKARAASEGEIIKAKGQLEIEREKSRATIELDRNKFETTLILKAAESDDEAERIRNLKFYLKAGFIKDPEGKIAAIQPSDYPSNPAKPLPLVEQDLNDPAFLEFPKPLIDMLRRINAGVANVTTLQSAAATVERLVKIPLNDNQKSALIALIYNIGSGRFSTSTLLTDINAGRTDRVQQNFVELVPRIGNFSKALEARRRSEAELFLAPVN